MTPYRPRAKSGPLGTLLAAVTGAALLVVGLLFSIVVLVVVAVAGTLAWGYFRWKTRELRKTLNEHPPGGVVIDGEVIVVDDAEPARPVIVADIRNRH